MRPELLLALVYVLVWRVVELALSARNRRKILGRGGRLVEQDGMGGIVLVHSLWILGLILEAALQEHPVFPRGLRMAAASIYVLSELVRIACIWTLGERWNVRVILLPGVAPVAGGPYRWLKHPNYAAVVVGLVALPLALGLPWTALLVLPLKLLALRKRLRVENEALTGSNA